MTEVKCPKCSSANVMFSLKRKVHVCEDCAHEWTAGSKPFAPLRIFLSYGHDDNVALVRRFYADLKNRGHDVWFDKEQIKFGDDWRCAITGSNKDLSFLSRHSSREPGVCLAEH